LLTNEIDAHDEEHDELQNDIQQRDEIRFAIIVGGRATHGILPSFI
jgi:hypothetical protein